jgi:hypothetical protein
MAREEAYAGWLSHFLMLEFGVRRVIVESHHDGRALSSSLRSFLRPERQDWLPEPEGRGGAFGYDIVVTRTDDVDARTFQSRFSEYAVSSIDARRREAGRHLLQFLLLVEVKLVDQASDLLVTDMMARDLVKLAATSAAASEFSDILPVPETAFVIVLRGEGDLPSRTEEFFSRLRRRAENAFVESRDVQYPHLFLVAHSGLAHS